MALFGGNCNNLMSESTKEVINYIQQLIGHVPYPLIKQFIQLLSPILSENHGTIFQDLYQALSKIYTQKRLIPLKFQEIGNQILKIARNISEDFDIHIRKMLDNQCVRQQLKKIFVNNLANENIIQTGYNYENQMPKYMENPINRLKNISAPDNKAILNKIGNMTTFTTYQNCQNLIKKPSCLCTIRKQYSIKDETSFRCRHCNKLYHVVCMKKKQNAEYCAYCQLQRMAPLKKVIQTLFIAHLKKTIKKHSLQIDIPELNPNQKIQIRCIRLKEEAQNAYLFPDVAQILINGTKCNSFEPINKQSCLKYRKDEPFILLKSDIHQGRKNKIQISEILQTVKQKQLRNQPENHLLGVFLIQQIKIDTLINQTKQQRKLGFSQSKNILESNLNLTGTDQITLQLIKIPLTCPLSIQKIDIPVRGIFCKHFQCFDMKNYVTIISESTNPRWKCPICGVLAYQLQLDPILKEIINKFQHNQKIKQVLFYKNGDYLPIINDQPFEQKSNINQLNIPERIRLNQFEITQKTKKRNVIVPNNVEIIDISD